MNNEHNDENIPGRNICADCSNFNSQKNFQPIIVIMHTIARKSTLQVYIKKVNIIIQKSYNHVIEIITIRRKPMYDMYTLYFIRDRQSRRDCYLCRRQSPRLNSCLGEIYI